MLLIATIALLSVNCRRAGGLFVSGGNPPSFEIRRSSFDEVRIFPIFLVYELHSDNEKVGPQREDDAKNRIVWRIVSKDSASSAKLEKIEYAKVPAGYTQEIPGQGAPEELQENKLYEARGALSLMGYAVARFKIVKGKVISQPLPLEATDAARVSH